MRFRNVERNKDGKSIASSTDLKHEIQIITLPNDSFQKFKDFLELHTLGNLIDPDTGLQYRLSRSWFDTKKHHVNREFFKKLGKLSDDDLKEMFTLLVDVGTGEGATPYPKLSFHKTKHYHRSHLAVGDWCIRRKSKCIAFEEMKAVKNNLVFFKPDSDVVDQSRWNAWKKHTGFSSASWNMILSHLDTKFFSSRLQNLGKLKTAKELKDRFPTAEDFFTNFTILKNFFREPKADFFLRSLNLDYGTLSPHWDDSCGTPKVLLGVFDLRDTYYALCKGDEPARHCVQDHMERMKTFSNFSVDDPTVWVVIVNGPSKKLVKLKAQVQAFFSDYNMEHSQYRVARAERLYNISFPERIAHDVHLLFLFKKDV